MAEYIVHMDKPYDIGRAFHYCNIPHGEIRKLPVHGDLIDAHAFATKVAEAQDKVKGKDYDPFMLLGDVLRWIELAPVVVEASK